MCVNRITALRDHIKDQLTTVAQQNCQVMTWYKSQLEELLECLRAVSGEWQEYLRMREDIKVSSLPVLIEHGSERGRPHCDHKTSLSICIHCYFCRQRCLHSLRFPEWQLLDGTAARVWHAWWTLCDTDWQSTENCASRFEEGTSWTWRENGEMDDLDQWDILLAGNMYAKLWEQQIPSTLLSDGRASVQPDGLTLL